jgi:hypothetical protein
MNRPKTSGSSSGISVERVSRLFEVSIEHLFEVWDLATQEALVNPEELLRFANEYVDQV